MSIVSVISFQTGEKNMLKKMLVAILCAGSLGQSAFAASKTPDTKSVASAAYARSPYISEEAWREVQEYLLPVDHPIKPALDRIFRESRVTASHEAMEDADFSFDIPRGDRRLTAAKHSKLKGYLVKTFLDTQNTANEEWKIWIHRIKGAKIIQESIEKHGFEHLLKVPKKWIYPLPADPSPAPGTPYRQNFVMIVEDMHILNVVKSKDKFMKALDKEFMDALYVVIKENLLIDSIYIDNIPFCSDGKIAFIDTEHYRTDIKPLKLHRMTKYFSPIMQEYWIKVMKHGGPLEVNPDDPNIWKMDKKKLKERIKERKKKKKD